MKTTFPAIFLTALSLSMTSLNAYSQEHDIEYFKNHVYLKTEINGKPANLIFDTGAEVVYLDSTYVADNAFNFKKRGDAMINGVGSDGPSNIKIIIGEVTVIAAGQTYKPDYTPIINLRTIVGDQADGIFGMKAIDGKIISIDYKNLKLNLYDKLDPQMTEGYQCVPVKIQSRQILVPLKIAVNSHTVITGDALMDLGSGSGIAITSPTATKYSLDTVANKTPFTNENGGLGGKSTGYIISIANADIAGVITDSDMAKYHTDKKGSMASTNYIANLGNEVWSRFDIILDLADNKIYLKKN